MVQALPIAHWLPSKLSMKSSPLLSMPEKALSGAKVVNTHDADWWTGAMAGSRITKAVPATTCHHTAHQKERESRKNETG